MCGFAAVLNLDGHYSHIPSPIINAMRDRIEHRGPDDSGVWQGQMGSIGHRRLIVVDTSAAGHQPMVSSDGRYILAYNGELYNDHDLRSQLATLGHHFKSKCDTETLLHALIEWDEQAINKLRGMFSFIFLDTQKRTTLIARDPMGIKPLYHSTIATPAGRQLIIASEISAILEHPQIDRSPDPVTVSAYLSSIRTTLGERTMYKDISALKPGEWIKVDMDNPQSISATNWWDIADRTPTQSVRQTIEDSVHRHLRTDVPMCTLLSGGLDSAITTFIAKQSNLGLHTFCAGAKTEGFSDDFHFAAMLANELGTTHHEVIIDQKLFLHRWEWMIAKLATPLSTPNEVAIYEVASTLRRTGHIVALSGEGADELFGGYAPIIQQANAYIANPAKQDPGVFHLQANAWVSEELKPAVLQAHWMEACHDDAYLKHYYQSSFAQVQSQSPNDSPLQAHLRFQRMMNLPNLLQRLDTSTMLAGVEGRTPFADIEVALCAEMLPIESKYTSAENEQTKIALRQAFKDDLPEQIVHRPKASFPLPFQHWMQPMVRRLQRSEVARSLFTDQAIELVCSSPANYWHMAWPMINLTLWGEHHLTASPPELAQPTEMTTCSGK